MRNLVVLCASLAACGNSSPGNVITYPVDPAAIQKACAMEVSCLPNAPISAAGSCVSQFEIGLASGFGVFFGPSASDLDRYVRCASAASNCAGALNCASLNHGADWCTAHPNGACDGDTVVRCQSGWALYRTDCAAQGLHCATANGASTCTDGSTCDPTTPAHCDGNRLVECDATTHLGSSTDCGALAGGTCRSVTSGTSTTTNCYAPQAPGCATDGTTCDGTAAVLCASGLKIRVECAQFASHCALDSMGKAGCEPNASECTSSTADTCSGDAIQLCVNGRVAQTSCASIGLVTCSTANSRVTCN